MRQKKYNYNDEIKVHEDLVNKIMGDDCESKKIIMYHLTWYCKKGKVGRFKYKILNFLVIVLTAIIPVFNLSTNPITKYASSLCGISASILTGIITFFSYKLSWLRYREAAECIKKEIRLASSRIGEYKVNDEKDIIKKLIENVEKIAGNENTNWKKFLNEGKSSNDNINKANNKK